MLGCSHMVEKSFIFSLKSMDLFFFYLARLFFIRIYQDQAI